MTAQNAKISLFQQLLVRPDRNDPNPLILYHGRRCPDGFGAALAANYSTTSVRLLKIDCDGCEFSALPAWVTTVCTDQIVVEVHRTLRWKPKARVRIIHALMLELDKLYRIFYLETNAAFPWLGTEYSLVRRTPCHRVEDLSE
jgi:hypothetical protein